MRLILTPKQLLVDDRKQSSYFRIADQVPSDEAIRGLSVLLRFVTNHPPKR